MADVTTALLRPDAEAPPGTSLPPLAVDLDGTLVTIDSLHESAIGCVRLELSALRGIAGGLRRGKAAFKAEMCSHQPVDASLMPYNQALIAYLREQRLLGRVIGLFTAADQAVADAVSRHLGLFSVVRASDGITNLSGRRKLDAIREAFGDRFVYAGDAAVDHAVFAEAEQVVLVGAVDRLRAGLPRGKLVEAAFPVRRAGLAAWAHALRLRHWSKNLLVFAAPILGLHVSGTLIAQSLLLFGMLASATYLLNDLLDLQDDRQHPQKCLRPLAAGTLSTRSGVLAALCLLVAAFAGSLALPGKAALTLLEYLLLTLAYSLALKRQPFVDVVVLAGLFTMRVLAGSVLIPDRVSPWLLTFSTLMFVGLAMVKRHAELDRVVAAGGAGLAARGYNARDLPLLLASGVAAAFSALVIFTVYLINDQYPRNVYRQPELLWAIVPIILLWTLRVWRLTVQGQMDEDPVVFALRDRFSLALGALVSLVLLAAWL